MVRSVLESVNGVYTCTCGACPTQYEGRLLDGRMVYIRYRWGYLSIRISNESTTDISDAVNGTVIYGRQLGEDLDGSIEWTNIASVLDSILLPPYNFWSNLWKSLFLGV
jgi:hypothetical protein